jgi:serpin B
MMNNDFYTGYMEVPGQYQAIMLMYHYNPDETIRNYMVIILPENLQTFENSFTYDVYNSILDNMTEERVVLAMPKFDFEYKKNMNNTLISLGMVDAFNPGASDFSGINGGTKLLFIEKIYHKSFISVDENGTEAAAATFGTLMPGVDPPPTMTIDRPFIFVIGNANTGAILFIGRAAEL